MDLTVLSLVAVVAILVVAALEVWRRNQQAQREALQQQIERTNTVVSTLREELVGARADQREHAERHRAHQAEAQAAAVTQLQQQMTEVIGLVQKQMTGMQRALDERMTGLRSEVGERLADSNKVIHAVRGQLGGLSESAKHMAELGRDIAGLHDILRAPKLRGNLGEMFLEELLRQVLPSDAYAMQHRLHDGQGGYVTVDAIIRLGERLVPVDSKFPLESFQRLLTNAGDDEGHRKARKEFLKVVRSHVDVIADKYIRPELGTYEFALMYLPAENVYYEAVVRDDDTDAKDSIVNYAASKRVIPVSPNTFYAYLLTVAYGLKGMQIEKQAEGLRTDLMVFHKKFERFYKQFDKVGRNIQLAQKGYDEAHKQVNRLNDQVGAMTGHSLELEGGDALAEVVAQKRQGNLLRSA